MKEKEQQMDEERKQLLRDRSMIVMEIIEHPVWKEEERAVLRRFHAGQDFLSASKEVIREYRLNKDPEKFFFSIMSKCRTLDIMNYAFE